jgi:hypothetical protein
VPKGLKGDDDRHEDDGQRREQDGECHLVGGLLPVRAFDQGDHPVQERVAALGGVAHNDAVREHRGSAGHRGAVTTCLADHRGGFAGDRRLVDRRQALGDLSVGGDEVTGRTDHEVTPGQRGGCHPRLGPARHKAAGFGVGAHSAQRVGLGLAAPLSIKESHLVRLSYTDAM